MNEKNVNLLILAAQAVCQSRGGSNPEATKLIHENAVDDLAEALKAVTNSRNEKRFVVRVIQTHTTEGEEMNEGDNLQGNFLQCLHYAGIVTIHETVNHKLNSTSRCFDIYCPNDGDSREWSKRTAEVMTSCGFNAVSAPATV